MIIPTIVNKDVFPITEKDLVSVLAECVRSTKACIKLESVLKEPTNNDEEEQEKLDELMMLESDITHRYLSMYVEGLCAPTDILFRRANNALQNLKVLREKLEIVTMKYIYPDAEASKALTDLADSIAGELGTFMYFAFSLDRTEDSLKAGGTLVYSLCVSQYVDDHNLTIAKFVEEVQGIMVNYAPTLDIFDSLPYTSEEFFNIVGSLIYDFDYIKEFVTAEIVVGVIKGEIEPEEAVNKIREQMASVNG